MRNSGTPSSSNLPIIAIMTTCSFVVLCAAVILLATIVRPKGYRSAAKRSLDHVKWRLQGMPKSGTISVVVTDIEGYSGGCHGLLPTAAFQG
jgi:hypothetical protein